MTAARIWIIEKDAISKHIFEIPDVWTQDLVQAELCHWGIHHTAFRLALSWCPADFIVMTVTSPACVYISIDETKEPILSFQTPTNDVIAHMSRLCTFGFPRAIVLDSLQPDDHLQIVYFQDYVVAKQTSESSRPTPTLPQPVEKQAQKRISHRLQSSWSFQTIHQINLPFPSSELGEIFESCTGMLLHDVSHLPLTELQIAEIDKHKAESGTPHISDFDRLLVFVDGSSDPTHKHHHLTYVDEFGKNDAWAFAVVGEKYDGEKQDYTFLGWTSQAVCYETDSPFFTGVERVGADVAEREALLWAGLWRLSIDSDVPTAFCFDSIAAGHFADGTFGSTNPTLQHRLLRGVFQTIQEILGHDKFLMHHVHGHCGLLWNELVDAGAKYNSRHVCFNKRQQIDLRKWQPVLQHYWIFFAGRDVPQLTEDGLRVTPPSLPSWLRSEMQCFPQDVASNKSTPGQIWLSCATANVRTLATGPDGYQGKIDYLQSQFDSFGLVMIGLQETRTNQGLVRSRRQHYLRYCSGHEAGHHGVELWLSTKQPLGYHGRTPVYIQAQNVVILHRDPRRLVARIETTLDPLYVAVLHGPQSGIEEEYRKCWWEETVGICQTCNTDRLILLCDANASSGVNDGTTVFDQDDDTTPNTPFFRDLLCQLHLCIPSTGDKHFGEQTTWISPDARTSRRIDFVCIPQVLRPAVCVSTVLSDIDLGNGDSDHTTAAIQMKWNSIGAPTTKRKPHLTIDASLLKSIPQKAAINCFATRCPWENDIETQVDTFNEQVQKLLGDHCRPQVQEAKKPFFTEEMWILRGKKLQCRRSLKKLHGAQRRELLAACFQSWNSRRTPTTEVHLDEAWNYRSTLSTYSVRIVAQLFAYDQCLRQAIKTGKNNYMCVPTLNRCDQMPVPARSCTHYDPSWGAPINASVRVRVSLLCSLQMENPVRQQKH